MLVFKIPCRHRQLVKIFNFSGSLCSCNLVFLSKSNSSYILNTFKIFFLNVFYQVEEGIFTLPYDNKIDLLKMRQKMPPQNRGSNTTENNFNTRINLLGNSGNLYSAPAVCVKYGKAYHMCFFFSQYFFYFFRRPVDVMPVQYFNIVIILL